jgi:endonuclease-3
MAIVNYHEIFNIFAEYNPNPTTELLYNSHFELLIAVILSAQATDISVNKATRTLFAKANNPEKILAIGEDELIGHIKSIGLFKSKARHIIATCHILVTKYNGEIPKTRMQLEQLPGVGRKTANVVLNTAFNQNTIAIDTHIFRVARRTKMAVADTTLGVEKILLKKIPEKFLKNAHHWLILHGRYTCKARKPMCLECPIYEYCLWQEKLLR